MQQIYEKKNVQQTPCRENLLTICILPRANATYNFKKNTKQFKM